MTRNQPRSASSNEDAQAESGRLNAENPNRVRITQRLPRMHLTTTRQLIRVVLLLALPAAFTACSSVYYGALEKVGIAKRDVLVDRVEEAREAQTAAKEQFNNAL